MEFIFHDLPSAAHLACSRLTRSSTLQLYLHLCRSLESTSAPQTQQSRCCKARSRRRARVKDESLTMYTATSRLPPHAHAGPCKPAWREADAFNSRIHQAGRACWQRCVGAGLVDTIYAAKRYLGRPLEDCTEKSPGFQVKADTQGLAVFRVPAREGDEHVRPEEVGAQVLLELSLTTFLGGWDGWAGGRGVSFTLARLSQ